MHVTFVILAGLILASSLAAILLSKLVHSVLCLTLTFAGLAALYLQLGAEFVGFAQVLIYIGAVAILIVFAIMLTRTAETESRLAGPSWLVGAAITALVFGCLAISIVTSRLPTTVPAAPQLGVRHLGEQLMAQYVLPLQVAGLLLTAALIGAVLLAMTEPRQKPG